MATTTQAPSPSGRLSTSAAPDPTVQRWCALFAPGVLVVFFIGFWPIAGYVPPPSPMRSAAEVARFYQTNTNGIRIGLIIGMFACCWIVPWSALLSQQMRHAAGRMTPMVATQFAFGVIAPLFFIVPMMIWLTATYRPYTRPVQLTYLLDDTGWLFFIVAIFIIPPWLFSVALTILSDKSARPIFPRWAAYWTLGNMTLTSLGCLAIFVKDGPLAWNGIVGFWLVFASFALWTIVMSVLMYQAGERLRAASSVVP